MGEKRILKEVGIFGYTEKDKLGDLIKELKTDLNEEELLKYCELTFKGYTRFSFSWINGEIPNFIKGVLR